MDSQTSVLLFTDLDGTLLGHEDYAYDAALPVLAQLQALQIPVIPVTSKTRAEVSQLRAAVGLRDPYVVENGGGIFLPADSHDFGLERESTMPNTRDRVLPLGIDYAEAQQALRQVSKVLKMPLVGFGEMSVSMVQHYTGLSLQDAAQAKQRHFSEPFLTPKGLPAEHIRTVVRSLGYEVVVGDRFSHLIGVHSGKGRAVEALVQLYQKQHPDAQIRTVGLGNSPNDITLLEAVDIAIVMPGEAGPHPQLRDRGWRIAPSPAPLGWAQAVTQVLAEFGRGQ